MASKNFFDSEEEKSNLLFEAETIIGNVSYKKTY